jgi:hypothetical protein
MVDRCALIGLPQVSHLRPARAFARASDRTLMNLALRAVRRMVTLMVLPHRAAVKRYRYNNRETGRRGSGGQKKGPWRVSRSGRRLPRPRAG